jgi:hypothetical protein
MRLNKFLIEAFDYTVTILAVFWPFYDVCIAQGWENAHLSDFYSGLLISIVILLFRILGFTLMINPFLGSFGVIVSFLLLLAKTRITEVLISFLNNGNSFYIGTGFIVIHVLLHFIRTMSKSRLEKMLKRPGLSF